MKIVTSRQVISSFHVNASTLKHWVKIGLLRPWVDSPGRGNALVFSEGEMVILRAVILLKRLGMHKMGVLRSIIDGIRDADGIGHHRFELRITGGFDMNENTPLFAGLSDYEKPVSETECLLSLDLSAIRRIASSMLGR